MSNSGNGDAPKFGAYLISLDSSLAGAGRLNPRKREAGADEPAARRMLSIWPCRPPSTGPTRAGSRASRPLTPSFIYIHIYVGLCLNSHYPRRRWGPGPAICSMHPCFEEIVPNHDAGNHLATTVGAEMNRKGMRFLYFDTPFCTLIRSEDENFAADCFIFLHGKNDFIEVSKNLPTY